MHFWIDKRAQSYGFGRSRVGTSLAGAGSNGLGFPHPPRRMGGKTNCIPPIHRVPQSQQQQQQHSHSSHGHQQQQQSTTIDCHRSHSISNNNNNNNNAHNSNHSHSNNNHHSNSNSNYNSSTNSGVVNNNNNHSSSGTGTIVHYSSNRPNRGCRNSTISNATLNNNNHHEAATATLTTTTTRSYHHHPQFGNMSIRHYQGGQQSSAAGGGAGGGGGDHVLHNRGGHHHHHHHNSTQRTHSSTTSGTTVTSVSLSPIYISPSHAQSLEEGPLGMGPIPTVRLHQSNTTGTVTTTTTSAGSNQILDATDAQVLPLHLKYGMWATLILAAVFVFGAKFYADHQGTGLEVLIFAAFSATFFLAACTVSICRLPNSLAASPSLSIDDSSRGLLNQQNNQQLSLHYAPAQQQQQPEILELTPTGAPPPYHIAILLPENAKEIQFKDESPPPSYDKIVI